MTMITTDQLKDFSVKVVEEFVNNKVPLSEGIAKCASDMELNPEQTKRMVETTNTIAYLKLQKEASDKTFEFPLADYAQVMGVLCLPGASDTTLAIAEFQEHTKQAGEVLFEASFNPDNQTIQAWAMKEMLHNRSMLQKLAVDKAEVLMNIGDLQKVLFRDEYVQEKLAEVCDEEDYKKLSILVKKAIDTPLRSRVFKSAELTEVRQLVDLYKKAQELIKESQQRDGLEKKAIVMALAGGLGKAVGGALGGAAALGVKGGIKAVKSFGKSKLFHPLDVAGAALSEPKPDKNIWDNLQGSQKRF